MPIEPLSPELALVDPELRARARAALPDWPSPPQRPYPRPRPAAPGPVATAEPDRSARAYPLWARLAATLWVLVVGILIGGAAVPHAQDRPRVIPRAEDASFCERAQPKSVPPLPARPLGTP